MRQNNKKMVFEKMLLKSPRQTKKDLEFWRIISQYDKFLDINRKVEQAKQNIINFVQSGDCYIGTSWGKDSVVVADIATTIIGEKMKLINLRVLPNRNPHCDDVRDIFLNTHDVLYKEFLVDYRAIIAEKLTQSEYDKQTNRLFFGAFQRAAIWCGTDRHISGVRASESNVRKLRCMRWGANTDRTCAPLAWWSSDDVFAYLEQSGLPIHPNYSMVGGGRWDRAKIRTAEIGDVHGNGIGRLEWEKEYYSDILRRSGYGYG